MSDQRNQAGLGRTDLNLSEVLNLQIGGKGTYLFTGTTNYTKPKCRLLQINEDVVFTELKDENGKDLLVNLGIAGNTCVAGSIIKPLNGKKIAVIELASGSAWGII